MCNNWDTFFKCLRATESIRTMGIHFFVIIKRGSFSEPRIWQSMVFRATIGYISELPRYGMLMVWVSFLSWMVLDHLIITVAPHWVKMTSPQAICLVKSYCLVVCDNKLERRSKEKKIKEYKAMNVTLCSRPEDVAMTWCNLSIVRP